MGNSNVALNFDDVVKSSAQPKSKTAKKASGKEIITNASNAVKDAISNIIKAKSAKKKAESDIKIAETPVIEFGNGLKDDMAFEGDYNKSYKVQGKTPDEVITFVTANKFSHNEDDEEDISELMGEENFNDLMPKDYVIKVRTEIFEDPKLQKELMKKMGSKFNEFFEVESNRKVISTFDEELYKRFDADKVADIKVLVKQSKPSIR